MDNVHAVYESILDWDQFSVRVREEALPHVPQILESISPDRVAAMQRKLARVWHRFAWATGPLLRSDVARLSAANLANDGGRSGGGTATGLDGGTAAGGGGGSSSSSSSALNGDVPHLNPLLPWNATGGLLRVRQFPFRQDAFSTLMAWLYARIPDTRGGGGGGAAAAGGSAAAAA